MTAIVTTTERPEADALADASLLSPALFCDPPQGRWTVADWAALEGEFTRGIELVDGCLEFLPMPSGKHLILQEWIRDLIASHLKGKAAGRAGRPLSVTTAPWKVRVTDDRGRQPDVVVYDASVPRSAADEAGGILPDGSVRLVVEIVSPGRRHRTRDLVEKREDYAAAGIAEYWIVDPDEAAMIVLTLDGADASQSAYREAGTYGRGDKATSPLLEGLAVDIDELIAADA